MIRSVELTPGLLQRLLSATLRATTWLLFRSGFRPGVRPQVQRRLLRLGTRLCWVSRGVRVEPGTLGGVPGEWLRPARENGTVLLYLHGGAFIVGSPQTHRSITSYLARHGDLPVFAVDYRLAPEHAFPAASDDALAAYQALLAQGYAASRIVIAGDSVGGNLVLATAVRARDAGLPLPAALVCFSPVTDCTGANLLRPPAGDPLIQPSWLQQGADAYCPQAEQRRRGLVSPLYAELAGLPPLLIQVGADEWLLPQSQLLAERARAAGVDCELELYPRQWHVFQINCGLLAIANLALQRTLTFIRTRGLP